MRGLTTMLLASNCLTLSVWATTAGAQSALPQFSDPYGGLSAYVHADGAGSPAHKPATKSSAKTAKRSAAKSAAHRLLTHKVVARKRPIDADGVDLGTNGLTEPTAAAPPPVVPRATAATNTKSQDSPLGLDLKWSAASGPYYNPSSSTVPAVDEIKRNENETPAETGSAIEAGVNLKF